MRLHENEQLFRQAVRVTAQSMGIPDIFVEKDYWTTLALYTVYQSDMATETIFKGGTALSKCFGLIERFSEDIDLVVKHCLEENENQLKRKIRAVSKVVEEVMPEVQVEGLTIKRGMNRKTAHSYPHLFRGNFGQAREQVIVEATWLGYFEPHSPHKINTYIYNMMVDTGQTTIAQEYKLEPFEVEVLDPKRTFCEKIMSLVRFSYGENPIYSLQAKIRHTYDLHQLLQEGEIQDFFNSSAFEEMLIKVAQDDIHSFRNNNDWLQYHPNKSLLFSDLESITLDLEVTYLSTFKDLVYGKLPAFNAVCQTLTAIRDRMATISWEIV